MIKTIFDTLRFVKGVATAPIYPDLSTREKARSIANAFLTGQGVKLLPSQALTLPSEGLWVEIGLSAAPYYQLRQKWPPDHNIV